MTDRSASPGRTEATEPEAQPSATDSCIVIQCTHSDLLTSEYRPETEQSVARSPDSYAVGPLAAAGLAPLVLAAPDTPENRRALPAVAHDWGVDLFLGEELNIVRRLIAAARAVGVGALARVVMPSFYVEPTVVAGQLRALAASDADYCVLPNDFNINFGADVVRVEVLERLDALAENLPAKLVSLVRYRPWPFLELWGEHFSSTIYEDLPEIAAERLQWIRAHPNWPERAGPGFEGGEYRELARELLTPDDVVLDAGCGHGEISNIFSEHCKSVLGLDYDEAMIEIARSRFPHCEFLATDLEQWRESARFDVVFHCHTLEHCRDPIAVLSNLRASLKPGGRLVVEVPLLLRPGIVNPHHEREYTVEMLEGEVAAAGLRIVARHGVIRGLYREPCHAREAFLVVCTAAPADAQDDP